jgi:hypothetical protein
MWRRRFNWKVSRHYNWKTAYPLHGRLRAKIRNMSKSKGSPIRIIIKMTTLQSRAHTPEEKGEKVQDK